jgi:hypothetical protein
MSASNSYSNTILADAPLRWYRLNDGPGAAADSSGNQQTGLTHGTITFNVASLIRSDTANTCFTFDGSTGYVSLPITALSVPVPGLPTGAAPWTLECWCSLAAFPASGNYGCMVAFGHNSTGQTAQIKAHNNGSTTRFTLSTFNGDIESSPISLNTVYHVVGTYDGVSTRLYVGTPTVSTTLVAGPTPFTLNLTLSYASIGADDTPTPAEFFNGTIDEVAIYSATLSPTQILAHYTAAMQQSKTLGVRARLVTYPQLTITIAGTRVLFDEDSWQLHLKADERQRCQFTVLDYAGIQRYTPRQQVVVTDPNLGVLFGGVVLDDNMDKSNMYPNTGIEHQIDTAGNEYFADKRTSNRIYATPQYASTIVGDALSDVLAAEKVGPLSSGNTRKFTSSSADWNTGTFSSTVATTNVGDGDLELIPSSSVTQSYGSNWGGGTFTNTTAQAGGDLSLTGYTRNWNDGVFSNQTIYGTNIPTQGVTNNQLALSTGSNADARSRFDFAGNAWQNFTAEFDFVVGPPLSSYKIVYRTDQFNWQFNNDTYAYTIGVFNNQMVFAKGSNSPFGSGNFTSLQAVNITKLTVGTTHHLKVVINGNSHIGYLDGVQLINATDSTYTAAGEVGLRFYNNTSGTLTGLFDNFGIQAALTGTWQSASTSINAITTIATSTITWDQSLSQGGTILVETSINAGSTWQTCANGGVIPGLTNGVSGTGKSVLVRITLTTTNAGIMPDVKSLSWTVLGGYTTPGTWVSPALTLTFLNTTTFGNRVGNTVVSWNANLPSAATTLGIDVSIDGGSTWADVTTQNGGPIPQLNGTPEPTVDGFNSNTSANYTSMIGYSGGMATWTFDTAHSRIIATNGASAVYLNNAISIQNIDLFVDMDLSDAGGMVWNYSDARNYYGLRICDNQSSVGTPNTITLFKTVAGVQSTLATANISWQRGTYRRIRATTYNPYFATTWLSFNISFDGTSVISVNDSTPLPTGQCGLYATGGFTTNYALLAFGPTLDLGTASGIPTTARFYQFWVQPLGDLANSQSIKTRCRLATTDSTLTPQVLDLIVAAYPPQIGIGALIPAADYRQKYLSQVLDDLAKQSNYIWYIDQNKQLNFRQRSAIPAPWILQSSSIAPGVDLEMDSNLAVKVANDLYRNRQVLTGVIWTGPFVGNFQGDGQNTSFTLTNPVAPGTMPVITLNLVPQKVSKKGTTGSQFYYADNDPVIVQDSTIPVLVSTDRLKVTFTGTYIAPLTLDNVAAQTALKGPEGGSGIVEVVEDVSKRNMTVAAATVYGNQLLIRYCLDGRTVTFATYRDGLAVGQILNTFLPEYGLFDIPILILSIDVTMRTQPNNQILYFYVVNASELPNPGSWQKLLASSILLT